MHIRLFPAIVMALAISPLLPQATHGEYRGHGYRSIGRCGPSGIPSPFRIVRPVRREQRKPMLKETTSSRFFRSANTPSLWRRPAFKRLKSRRSR